MFSTAFNMQAWSILVWPNWKRLNWLSFLSKNFIVEKKKKKPRTSEHVLWPVHQTKLFCHYRIFNVMSVQQTITLTEAIKTIIECYK